MAIEQEFDGLYREFRKADANLSYEGSQLRVRSANAVEWFNIPPMVEANHNRLPGWFLAGIWDTMALPSLNERPDNMLLQGWGFTPDAASWRLSISDMQMLVYDPNSDGLFIRNYSAGSTTDVGVFPAKSVFHAQKLFEENGWFSGEGRVESLTISDYLVR